jgi:hypothetical protein
MDHVGPGDAVHVVPALGQRGPDSDGTRYNHWWLWTDLDFPEGSRGWISAYYVPTRLMTRQMASLTVLYKEQPTWEPGDHMRRPAAITACSRPESLDDPYA